MDVTQVNLPGVGILHTLKTEEDDKLGVIAHRSGRIELVSFCRDLEGKTEKNTVIARMNEQEAHTLAELIGGTHITESITALDHLHGLSIDWFLVEDIDYIARIAFGALEEHLPTGVSVVAIVRQKVAIAAPSADVMIFPGDTLLVAGTGNNVLKAFELFRVGPVQLESIHSPPE